MYHSAVTVLYLHILYFTKNVMPARFKNFWSLTDSYAFEIMDTLFRALLEDKIVKRVGVYALQLMIPVTLTFGCIQVVSYFHCI